jgi:transcriptional regulator with XRE-family HTH domain
VLVAERGLFIGETLRKLRLERGLTQPELAKSADVHPVTVSDLERNTRTASARSLKGLARALEVEIRDLTAPATESPPDEPGLTEENIDRIEAKKREKEERDEQTRRERDAHDTGDRTL